ncbi:unnamed protein product [Linum trigynum]
MLVITTESMRTGATTAVATYTTQADSAAKNVEEDRGQRLDALKASNAPTPIPATMESGDSSVILPLLCLESPSSPGKFEWCQGKENSGNYPDRARKSESRAFLNPTTPPPLRPPNKPPAVNDDDEEVAMGRRVGRLGLRTQQLERQIPAGPLEITGKESPEPIEDFPGNESKRKIVGSRVAPHRRIEVSPKGRIARREQRPAAVGFVAARSEKKRGGGILCSPPKKTSTEKKAKRLPAGEQKEAKEAPLVSSISRERKGWTELVRRVGSLGWLGRGVWAAD